MSDDIEKQLAIKYNNYQESILESFIAEVKAIKAELEKHLGEDQTMFSDFGAVTFIKLDGVEMLKGSGFTSVVYDEMLNFEFLKMPPPIPEYIFKLKEKKKAQWKQERNRYGGRK